MNKQEIIAGTLAWCNERRAEKGMKKLGDLPKGRRRDGSSCPCGNATGLFVGRTRYYPSPSSYEAAGANPESVTTFVTLFDEGELPEYEEAYECPV